MKATIDRPIVTKEYPLQPKKKNITYYINTITYVLSQTHKFFIAAVNCDLFVIIICYQSVFFVSKITYLLLVEKKNSSKWWKPERQINTHTISWQLIISCFYFKIRDNILARSRSIIVFSPPISKLVWPKIRSLLNSVISKHIFRK